MAQPTLLPSAWAVNGDKNTIPSSSAQQGVVNWNNGWDSVYSTPISTGGQAPVRADFNGVLNSISAHTIFAQNGGMYVWNATTTYDVNAIVQGSDNTAYIAVQGSNINHNPVNDTAMTYWRPLKGVPFTGASVSTAGNTGLVPAPSAGDQSKVLLGSGVWGAWYDEDILYAPLYAGQVNIKASITTGYTTLFNGICYLDMWVDSNNKAHIQIDGVDFLNPPLANDFGRLIFTIPLKKGQIVKAWCDNNNLKDASIVPLTKTIPQ